MGEPTVFVIDDDSAIRESIALLVKTIGQEVETFATAKDFLDTYDDQPGCVVSDIRMPGMSGLELQEHLAAQGFDIPVIILSAHGDVPGAVRAMKGGAMDFIEKPFNPQLLIDLMQKALDKDAEDRSHADRQARLAERIATLTKRQREVMCHVVAGKANKVIAIELDISERTVELHRSRIMQKTGARSLAELVRMGLSQG